MGGSLVLILNYALITTLCRLYNRPYQNNELQTQLQNTVNEGIRERILLENKPESE